MTGLRGLLAGLLILPAALAWAAPLPAAIRVASPEAVFLDVGRQMGGRAVAAEFIKASKPPARRPQILIYEGGSDEGWAPGALHRLRADAVIEASALASTSRGGGPSWYDLSAMGAVGATFAAALERDEPAETSAIATRRDGFLRALAILKLKAKEIADYYSGTTVLLTDPRFGPFCRSLGLIPVATAPDVEAIKAAIASHKGIVLVYNAEVRGGVGSLKALAEDAGLPLVGLRLTLPSGLSYQQWIGREINLIHGALNEAAP